MRMYDLIMKKRNGQILSRDEIDFMVQGYTTGTIPDYQMSAMMMAIYFRGMNGQETLYLTESMEHSGERLDLSGIRGIKVDKHSTGGVGDKTTLALTPMVAACGIPVAKMSGRGLGHTGGTIDKLESFPGFSTAISSETFLRNVNEIGIAIMGQTADLAPADKKLYALRDVTATVDNMSLIASSIMSKKLASGADAIVLDVKTGSGAFMKSLEDSIALAEKMVAIGEHAGRKTAALITNMDIPLGNYIGNSLEVIEAAETLKGKGPEDLTEVCLSLAANMLYLAGRGSMGECMAQVQAALRDGSALEKLVEMAEAQGGDGRVIRDTSLFPRAPYEYQVRASCEGWITRMDTEAVGISSALLGAGRTAKEDSVDYSAGIILKKKTGDYVREGEALAVLLASEKTLFGESEKVFMGALEFSGQKPEREPLIFARVEKEKIARF